MQIKRTLFRKVVKRNGRVHYLFCGIKICSLRLEEQPLTEKRIKRYQKRFKGIAKQIRLKLKRKKKLRVAFLVGMTSMFPARSIMDRMLKDDRFSVSIVLIPDLRFGVNRAIAIQEDSQSELKEYRDKIIVVPVNLEKDFLALSHIADIVVSSLPYDISHRKYDLRVLVESGLLPVIVNYGFYRSIYDRKLISDMRYGLYWKIFAETEYNVDEYRNYAVLGDENVVFSGYCKMDQYKNTKELSKTKTIMIAPHHSLQGGFNDMLALSNFDKYLDLYLTLPDRYPQLNFIFRPHPVLFIFLSREDQWGLQKTEEWISKMKSKMNVVYSEGGDYFKEFDTSDALIGDCGSYLVEYFYTGKPQCYLLKNSSDIENKFTELGKRCLGQCYLAYSEEEIIKFIDSVVLNGEDYKKDDRLKFAEEQVMVNYPNASRVALDNIIESLS